MSASALFWASYSAARHQLGGGGRDEPNALGALQLAGIASGSAAFAAAVTQPLDIVKTKMQVHQLIKSNKEGYRKVKTARFFQTFRETYAAGGVAGLWTGGAARTLSAAACGLLLGPLFEYG